MTGVQTCALPISLPPASKRPPNLLTSERGLDALERRLLAEVGIRKLGITPITLSARSRRSRRRRTVEKHEDVGIKKQKFSKINVRDVLSSSSPRAITEVVSRNKRLPHIDTGVGKGEEMGAGGSGRNGAPAPIAIPTKSPDPLNDCDFECDAGW